jgi:flagellar basal body P-ring protein FlgI
MLSRGLILGMLVLSLTGCSKFNLRSQSPDKDDKPEARKEDLFIGDQVTVAGLHPIQIEGVGLITGLNGTGEDPPPSMYRTMIYDDMRKRGIQNPNRLLQSPNTALVLVRAALPPVIQMGDRFDLEIVLPENSQATSLEGGFLLECRLAEQAITPGGRAVSGHVLAKAEGPVLVSFNDSDEVSKSSGKKRGKILGGAVYTGGLEKKERRLGLYLRNEYRNVRNAKRISDRIGQRFHYFDEGIKRPLAKATTDQHIELKVHPKYKDNYIRFVQVIRTISLHETPVERHARMERLKKQLQNPRLASRAAMELEAIGTEGIPILKEGLKSRSLEVRFYAADALAYLGDHAGLPALVEAAEKEPAFRVFALAAMTTLDDSDTHAALQDLMNEYGDPMERAVLTVDRNQPLASLASEDALTPADKASDKQPGKGESTQQYETDSQGRIRHGAELRYGAFRALRTLDANHPILHPERVGELFTLHALPTTGEPMVHLSRHRVQEVVLFGADQKLRTPIALSAGRGIVIQAASGADSVTISKFTPGKPDEIKTCSTRLIEIIRAAGQLDATYPDIAQMLVQAENQGNIPGRLELDALPQAGRIYHRSPIDIELSGPDDRETRTTVGNRNLIPNIFSPIEIGGRGKTSGPSSADLESLGAESDGGEASFSDVSEDEDDQTAEPEKQPGFMSRVFRNPFKGLSKAPDQAEPEFMTESPVDGE